ncbi:hypothetical protein [Enhygromyxa salina]|uniref:hypothetical protein n=1 Tax=Enhygromyxa salina TaxID=215803 RepID=UPI0006986FA8|nr:hypothetical protein [Enhygromyxa salina]
MTRPALLTSCLALVLSCFVPACDGGDDSSDDSSDTEATSTTSGGMPCGTEWAEKDGMTESIMDAWGAPCMQKSDCEPMLGADAQCVSNILGVYNLPGGFCTKYCELPDTMTTFIHDAADCDPAGGVTCVGAKDLFTACIIPCENDSQCGREGYGCRTMPTLASEGDPTFCLMNTTDCCTTDSGECA